MNAGLIFWLSVASAVAADSAKIETDAHAGVVTSFLESNCLDCHQGDAAEAGFDVETLSKDLADPEQLVRWVRVFDRVDQGEMPPSDYGEADPEEKSSFLRRTGQWIRGYQTEQDREVGRVIARRLTKVQLERSLQDLLAIRVPLANLMPEEPKRHGFNGIADAQSMSHYQLAAHLEAVDAALDAAFAKVSRAQPLFRREYTAKELTRKNPERRCRDPEWLHGASVVWSSNMPYYGRIEATRAKKSAWYRITFSASALNQPDGDGAEDRGVWCTVRRGDCISHSPLMTWIGAFEAGDEPKEMTFETWIPEGEMLEIRPGDATLAKGRFRGGQVGAGEGEPQGIPGLAVHGMTIQEIQPAGDAEVTRRMLFGDLPLSADGIVDGERVTAEQLADQLHRFARRAFRRPVEESATAPYREMLQRYLDDGQPPATALRMTYRALLCSPRFLYFTEPSGSADERLLDDFAIASRLSYFLCQAPPDAELRRLARESRLRDHGTLIAQADRLLKTERGRGFVKDFAAQWLELDQINFTEPDTKLYREFDPIVQDTMLRETHAFLDKLLRENAPVQELVGADYTYLNSRLARYYDIDGVVGDDLQLVTLSADSRRGGLLSHGSILKVTANGTDTSPVLRGVWLCDKVLGIPIPPPPQNVPAIEPDIRGATTIREMLIKHEDDPNCASCHRLIDPAGFALERFDAAGQWRDRYGRPDKQGRPGGLPVDAAGHLADGRTFDDYSDFRDLVAADAVPLARNVVEKMVVFSTGQVIRFADRERVDDIVRAAAKSDYGFGDLLTGVITSDLFLKK